MASKRSGGEPPASQKKTINRDGRKTEGAGIAKKPPCFPSPSPRVSPFHDTPFPLRVAGRTGSSRSQRRPPLESLHSATLVNRIRRPSPCTGIERFFASNRVAEPRIERIISSSSLLNIYLGNISFVFPLLPF